MSWWVHILFIYVFGIFSTEFCVSLVPDSHYLEMLSIFFLFIIIFMNIFVDATIKIMFQGSSSKPQTQNFLDPAFLSDLPIYYLQTQCTQNSTLSVPIQIVTNTIQQGMEIETVNFLKLTHEICLFHLLYGHNCNNDASWLAMIMGKIQKIRIFNHYFWLQTNIFLKRVNHLLYNYISFAG